LSKISEDILSNVDIIDIINKYVPLKRAGANFTACCPFHNEKTPSFMVSPTKQIFKCFGCGKWGNVITFVQEIERIDFWDAAKELAKQANIDITKYQKDPEKFKERNDEKEKMKRIHKIAQKFFVEQLEKNPEAKTYLIEQRKLSPGMIQKFGIGYAPNSHYELIQSLKNKWFSDQDIIEASLAKKSPTWGDVYAFFRHRITFPIYDTMNNIVGFSARIIDPNATNGSPASAGTGPKYLNSAEHKAFQKSQLLYGLNRAKQEIKEHDALCIVEGQMDVIGLARIGYHLWVATCGTALTPEHLKLIKRYTERVFLLFDNDTAGQEASMRALTLAYQNNIFPKIITLPEEYKDIDDLANMPDAKNIFDTQRTKSQDGFVVVFNTLKKKFDITSPIDKQKILNALFELIMQIDNINIQKHYLQVLGEQLGIRENIMETQYIQFSKKEGRFITQQKARNNQQQYKIEQDKEHIISALFFEDYIKQHIENTEKREQLLTLINIIQKHLNDTNIVFTTDNEQQKETLLEFQLRRDKEIGEQEEEKKYQTVKQIIMPKLQSYIKKITKDANISNDTKQEILNLVKKI